MDLAGKLKFLQNFKGVVAGTDEAGRGPLAGPVAAAAVILTQDQERILVEMGLKDSKKLSAQRREVLFKRLCELGVCWKAQAASVEQITRCNIAQASLWAMARSVLKLPVKPDIVVVDGLQKIPGISSDQLSLVKADVFIPAVSAASIVAKVLRDRVMVALDSVYPNYGFSQHKGYPTREHRERVLSLGLSPVHRPSFCQKLIQIANGRDAHGADIESQRPA